MVTTHFDFFKTIVIYEVNIRQYTPEGTFSSFSQHLPRLSTMGIDVLWLMPIHPIGVLNRKGSLGSYYAISDFHEVNPEFGTKADLKKLIEEAHAFGMKVILDWVANHVSCDHVWTREHPDFLVRSEDGSFYSPHGWEDVFQINHQNPLAHKTMINEMTYWVEEFDIDGFRADLAHLIPLEFWIAARHLIHQVKSNLIWLAESEEEDYFQAFDVLFAWRWMHLTEGFCKGQQPLHELLSYLRQQCSVRSKSYYKLYFTSNHDENSWNGTEFEKYGIYADLFTVLHFFLPFAVPLIYSGQELPNEKRLAFFDRYPINWDKPHEKYSFYRRLIEIRKHIYDFSCPEIEMADDGLLVLRRIAENREVRLFLNAGKNEVCFLKYKFNSSCYPRVLIQNENAALNKEGYLLPGDFIIFENDVAVS